MLGESFEVVIDLDLPEFPRIELNENVVEVLGDIYVLGSGHSI